LQYADVAGAVTLAREVQAFLRRIERVAFGGEQQRVVLNCDAHIGHLLQRL
jgi:hypothetical protein